MPRSRALYSMNLWRSPKAQECISARCFFLTDLELATYCFSQLPPAKAGSLSLALRDESRIRDVRLVDSSPVHRGGPRVGRQPNADVERFTRATLPARNPQHSVGKVAVSPIRECLHKKYSPRTRQKQRFRPVFASRSLPLPPQDGSLRERFSMNYINILPSFC